MGNTDKWIKCIAKGGNIMATAITAETLIEEAHKRHKLGPAETRALGEALLGGLLLGSTCKTGERVSLSVKGEGFLRQVMADAAPDGTVRGFIVSRDFVGQLSKDLGPWQGGLLSVARLKVNEKEPYVGAVPTITGHLAKDLTYYLSQSEQIPSAVGLAVNIGDDGKVINAGAFLVQILPGADPSEVAMVEENIHHLESLAYQISRDSDPTRLLAKIFDDLTFVLLEERPLRFHCNCSLERVTRALKLLGTEELSDMRDKDQGAQVTCDFCGAVYEISEPELGAMIKAIGKRD